MKQVRSYWEVALSESVERCLRPIVRTLLRLGMGASEFSSIAKSVFVQVASEEYGIRGRRTNASRVAAMTGLSRKEVARLRAIGNVRTQMPQQSTTPLNQVLHYWHSDPEFTISPGYPRPLPMEGNNSFETLVAKYGNDIPSGAIRKELESRDAIETTSSGLLKVHKRFVHAAAIDEDFLRNLAFSMEGLCTTLAHNTELMERIDAGHSDTHETHGRLERTAWTNQMTREEIDQFRAWVRREGSKFIEHADARIGERELPRHSWDRTDGRTVGVGLFYFEIHQP